MAIQALLVILAVLLVLLFLGVPISYAIAVSSLHPYAVLELKQLTSKEAAVKATPTPTTPVHP